MHKRTQLVAALALATGLGIGVSSGWVQAKTDAKSPIQSMPADIQQAIASASNLSTAFRAISGSVLPSVVSIENRPAMADANDRQWQSSPDARNIPSADPDDAANPFKGTPFEDFFGEDFDFRGMPEGFGQRMPRSRRSAPGFNEPQPDGGIGSGVIIDASGIILTNNHVVAGNGSVIVRTSDGREFTATEVLTDPLTDLAVVKIKGAENLTAATLGNSDLTDVGDWVLALGQPFGLESTVTAGIISAKKRGIGITERENFLQTDAAINPGNSGGPLVNLQGEIVGINTAISSRGGGNDGIGFAVPSNMARWVSDQLLDGGKVRRAYLGVGIQPVDAALAGSLGIPPRGGVLVTDVMAGTPAAATGLNVGDVIIKFDGKPVANPTELQLVVEQSQFGSSVDVEINRDGKSMVLKYTPTERPEAFGKLQPKSNNDEIEPSDQESSRFESLGLDIGDLDSETAKALNIENASGVVVTDVMANSTATEAGLRPGMVITQVNRKSVSNISEFSKIVDSSEGNLLCLVKDERGSRFVVLKR
jgi:serine protease Do